MKLIILKNNLKEGLMTAERGVSESAHLPILKNILLKTQDNKLKICSTNLEIGVTKFVSGKIIEEGGITLPFQTLYSLVNNINSEKINLETNTTSVIFKTDNYEAKIQGLHEDDYPIIPQIENYDQYLECDADIFLSALGQVVTSAQISEIRPEISGVLFDFQITALKLVATDSFRLSEKTLFSSQFSGTLQKAFKVIVPLKTIHKVLQIFINDQPIRIALDDNQICFKNSNVELISRLIDGTYPDYEQIIPKSFESELVVEKDHFGNALRLVSNFSSKVNDVRLKTSEMQKVLEVYAQNQFLGENNYLIPSRLTGNQLSDVAFNWRYLLDGLKAVGTNTLSFSLNGNTRPALLKSPEDASFFYIVMPIRF